MNIKYPDIKVKLLGEDGNAFAIMGAVGKALRSAGVDPKPYQAEAMAGDYDNLLRVTQEWVVVY
jgi:hypothetical protein